MSKETELQKAFEGVNYEKLPKPLKKDLTYLSKEIRLQELTEFSPLIDELMDLRKRSESLELTKEENGSIAKDSIEEFKSLKSDLRSFNAKIRKDIDECKRPYMDINKAFIAVKKGFEAEQTAMLNSAETTFKEYLEQEAEKKAERDRKKEDALRAEQKKQEEESMARMAEANKITAYNNLKYEILEDHKKSYAKMCETFSIDALKIALKKREELSSLMGFFEHSQTDYGFTTLDEDKQLDIISKYKDVNKEINEMISNSIAEKVEAIQKAVEEQSIAKAIPVNEPIEIKTTTGTDSNKEFENAIIQKVANQAEELFLIVNGYIEKNPQASPIMFNIEEQLRQLKNTKVKNGSNN